MSNTFKNVTATSVGATLTDIYTAPASTTVVIIGASCANILGSATSVMIDLVPASGDQVKIVAENTPVPVGSSLIFAGGTQKIVLEAGDIIKVKAEHADAIDVALSILEMT